MKVGQSTAIDTGKVHSQMVKNMILDTASGDVGIKPIFEQPGAGTEDYVGYDPFDKTKTDTAMRAPILSPSGKEIALTSALVLDGYRKVFKDRFAFFDSVNLEYVRRGSILETGSFTKSNATIFYATGNTSTEAYYPMHPFSKLLSNWSAYSGVFGLAFRGSLSLRTSAFSRMLDIIVKAGAPKMFSLTLNGDRSRSYLYIGGGPN